LKRGDVVTLAAGGGFGGKPRPALIVQGDEFARLGTVAAALFTGTLTGAANVRPRFQPDQENGLIAPSELMVDILVTVRRERVGNVIGRLNEDQMGSVDAALAVFLGLTR
jgi:mRNA interferase MazF